MLKRKKKKKKVVWLGRTSDLVGAAVGTAIGVQAINVLKEV